MRFGRAMSRASNRSASRLSYGYKILHLLHGKLIIQVNRNYLTLGNRSKNIYRFANVLLGDHDLFLRVPGSLEGDGKYEHRNKIREKIV